MIKNPCERLLADLEFSAEKKPEITPFCFAVYGLSIESRYGKLDEVFEMIAFVKLAIHYCVNHYVDSLFYDSKSGICNIELIDRKLIDPDDEDIIFKIAKSSLSLFCLLDFVDGMNLE